MLPDFSGTNLPTPRGWMACLAMGAIEPSTLCVRTKPLTTVPHAPTEGKICRSFLITALSLQARARITWLRHIGGHILPLHPTIFSLPASLCFNSAVSLPNRLGQNIEFALLLSISNKKDSAKFYSITMKSNSIFLAKKIPYPKQLDYIR
ncbi:hypothetical protein Y032_0769g2206 [Ancylostoma ceylanicum]|uniref:Uncharacterized protein n=1 Tax=Ancylostoma ceylanicum TaxID=53326 RepID=A0A016WEL6_9BILA|nr:hypothetical protein Y032_0769g2206 [Ancylostoma ceylanicum]